MAHSFKRKGVCEEELFGELEPVVIPEVPETGRLVDCARTRIFGVPDGVPWFVHPGQVFYLLFSPEYGGRLHNCVYDLNISCAAAGHPVLAVPLADLFPRRIRVDVQKCLARRDKSRGAESALYGSAYYERPLEGMKILGGTDAFDGRDLGMLGNVLPLRDAGTDYLAVHYHVADSALPVVAAPFRARHLELVADDCQQRDFRFADDPPRHSVDAYVLHVVGCFCHLLHLLSPLPEHI